MPAFDSRGVEIFYEETGSGPAIIWVHEFAADYRTWEAQVRRFCRHYRCVTYNARGYPPSSVPEQPEAYTYENHRDIIRLMDHLSIEKANLVGLSMGAYAEPEEFNNHIAAFLSAVERGSWTARDPRANPNQSVFMGDKKQEG